MDSQIGGNFKYNGDAITSRLPIIAFQEDHIFFTYAPALDLTGYGHTEDEAKQSFEEALDQFLRYSTYKGTLASELKRLGWRVSKKAVSKPPPLIEMINANDYLAGIFEKKPYQNYFLFTPPSKSSPDSPTPP